MLAFSERACRPTESGVRARFGQFTFGVCGGAALCSKIVIVP